MKLFYNMMPSKMNVIDVTNTSVIYTPASGMDPIRII